MTPISQQATILYRLVEGSMARTKPGTVIEWGKQVDKIPMECLPIPYTLTDFGRAYLAQLHLMEALAAEAAAAHSSNVSLPLPQGPHRKR